MADRLLTALQQPGRLGIGIGQAASNTKTASIPAPTRGLNTRDSLADMQPGDAIILDNVFPKSDEVTLRAGASEHATGIGSGAVETLMEYNGLSANKLFACGNSAIYNVTSAGAVGAAELSALTNNKWQWLNIGTSGGQFLFAVNGADAPISYNGSAWSNPSITGVTAANLVWCNLHQRRIFFGEKNKLSFWYLAVNSIAGAATEFPLAAVARLGGYIAGMTTWTRDGGSGMDDVAVFVTSEGEAIVYSGTDPASAATWSLIGVYYVGRPVGRRFFSKFGGEALCLTEYGLVPLSSFLSSDVTIADKIAVSARVAPSLNADVKSYNTIDGWQVFIYPGGPWVLVNVPTTANTTMRQWVFNPLISPEKGQWAACRFQGMNANCWGILNGQPYFGGTNGTVYKADDGLSDDGEDISWDIKTAFQYFGSKMKKQFHMVRPVFASNAAFSPAFDLNVDFADAPPTGTPTFSTPGSALWDVALWDVDSWSGDVAISKDWRSVTGLGWAAALRIRGQSNELQVSLRSIDFLFSVGGIV